MKKLFILSTLLISPAVFADVIDTSLISQTDQARLTAEQAQYNCANDSTCTTLVNDGRDAGASVQNYHNCDDDDDGCRNYWVNRYNQDYQNAENINNQTIKNAEAKYNQEMYKQQQLGLAAQNHGSATNYAYTAPTDAAKLAKVNSDLDSEVSRLQNDPNLPDDVKAQLIAQTQQRFANHQKGIMPDNSKIKAMAQSAAQQAQQAAQRGGSACDLMSCF